MIKHTFAIFTLGFVCQTAFSQTVPVTPLESGDDFFGGLAGQTSFFSLEVEAGEEIYARLTFPPGPADPQVGILGPDGSRVSWSPGRPNPVTNNGELRPDEPTISSINRTAPVSGTYTITVADSGNNDITQYNLSVAHSGTSPVEDGDNIINAGNGEEVTTTFSPGEIDVVSFHASEGAAYSILVDYILPDGRLRVTPVSRATTFGPDGNVASFRAATTGEHTVIIDQNSVHNGHEPNLNGVDYTFSVVVGGQSPVTGFGNQPGLPAGSDLSGILEYGDRDVISFTVNEGSRFIPVLNLKDEDADAAFLFFNPDGSKLSFSQRYGNIREAKKTAKATGEYVATLSDWNYNVESLYDFSLFISNADQIARPSNVIASGDVDITQTLRIADQDTVVVAGNVGDQVDIEIFKLDDSTIRPRFEVYRPDGSLYRLGTRQSFTLPDEGDYFIRVYEQSYDESGTYRLTVNGFTGTPTTTFADNAVVSNIVIPSLDTVSFFNEGATLSWEDYNKDYSIISLADFDPVDGNVYEAVLDGDQYQLIMEEPEE